MLKENLISGFREKLDTMVGKKFTYGDGSIVHLIKKYTVLADRGRVQVHTDQKDFDRPFESLSDFLLLFKPVRAGSLPAVNNKIISSTVKGHTPSSIIVYQTVDYSKFKLLTGNRKLNDIKINRIIKEISSGNDMLCYYPIQVREDKDRLDILDGQHRFYISKKLKRPVFYILVSEEKSMPDIAKINSNVDKWKAEDFINCFVQHGIDDYKKLSDFITKYNFSLSVTLLLLYTGTPGTEGSRPEITSDFKNGTFKVRSLEAAIDLAETCKRFSQFPNWRSRAFVIAIYKIKQANLISIDDLLHAYKKRPEMLTQQATYKSYANTLEQIVNVGKQKRIVII